MENPFPKDSPEVGRWAVSSVNYDASGMFQSEPLDVNFDIQIKSLLDVISSTFIPSVNNLDTNKLPLIEITTATDGYGGR